MHREATDNDGRRRHSVINRRGFLGRTGAIAAAGLGAAAFGDSRPMAARPGGQGRTLSSVSVGSRARILRTCSAGAEAGRCYRRATTITTTSNGRFGTRYPVARLASCPVPTRSGSPILVPDFDGRLVGAGAARTTITCTESSATSFGRPREAARTGTSRHRRRFPAGQSRDRRLDRPSLINFYKTPLQPGERPERRANRIEIRDIRCRGAMKGELWAFGDEVLCINVATAWIGTTRRARRPRRARTC